MSSWRGASGAPHIPLRAAVPQTQTKFSLRGLEDMGPLVSPPFDSVSSQIGMRIQRAEDLQLTPMLTRSGNSLGSGRCPDGFTRIVSVSDVITIPILP